MSTDDLTTARAFGLAARVADLEDQLAKLRHYHFSTLLNPASMFNAVGQVRDSTYIKLGIGSPAQFDYWWTSEVVNIEWPEGGDVETACQSQSPSQSQENEEYNEAETLP